MRTQPFTGAGARIEGRLLQGFQRGQAAVKPLQITLSLLLTVGRLLQVVAHLLQTLHELLFSCPAALRGSARWWPVMLAQRQNRRVFRVGRQQGALFSQSALALGHALHAGFQLLDPRLQALQIGAAARRCAG
jgi:hypothetical protein